MQRFLREIDIIKPRIFSFINRNTYKLRICLDNFLFLLMGRYNSWDVFDKFRSRDVLVIGNGPSLNKTELKRINMVSIGMNKINLLFDRTDWRPDIITCVNGLVIRQNKEFFNKTDVILVLPVRALYLGVKKRKNVIFLKPINSSEFSADITNGFAFCGSTVTYSVLQIAAYLNPESINIVGVDHYFKNYSGKSAVEKYEGDDSNHFDPRYFKDLLWGLPDLEGSERAYSIAKRYFDSKNIAITDYTIGGKLKIFNKGNIDNIYDKYPI